ncbi:MAG TPA: dihydrodipicolinate synthase family protein [Bacteroidales bacterium]|nr:dihydrodipicolinate synthase family protein [Bacteroidales bacterium]
MSYTQLTGTGVAIITPFNEDYSVDFPALEKVVEYCINGKVKYIAVLGTTGEPATLSKKEKAEVVDTVQN